MSESDRELADFQACLLATLDQFVSAADIQLELRRHDATLPFRDYLDGIEPEMLEVAALLVKKWGVKGDAAQGGGSPQMPH